MIKNHERNSSGKIESQEQKNNQLVYNVKNDFIMMCPANKTAPRE